MKILILNSGSSSIKCQYFIDQISVASITIESIGDAESFSEVKYADQTLTQSQTIADHHQALRLLFELLQEYMILSSIYELDAVGHRVVHGGAKFDQPTLITQEVIDTIGSLIPLAPLHNPANLDGIKAMQMMRPDLPQAAVFDTAFHQTMAKTAYLYPVPYELYTEYNIRRYGFHGSSHSFVAKRAAEMMKRDLGSLNLITLHIGNGASATAIESGESIDTSMGMTPLEGLMMGTRSGDIDPAIIPFLSENLQVDIDHIDKLLNKESGLKGICGTNDMRQIIEQVNSNDEMSRLALEMYTYRIKKYIGAYTVILGRVDAIIFTGGIGEHATKVREMVCDGLEISIGVKIDKQRNARYEKDDKEIHHSDSKIKLFVIKTDEELEIALQTEKLIEKSL
ncbi:MAG: acetate kinase [Campylobacterota bacterium]|nr:acetate kinase [Campylobacterota bacterium]